MDSRKTFDELVKEDGGRVWENSEIYKTPLGDFLRLAEGICSPLLTERTRHAEPESRKVAERLEFGFVLNFDLNAYAFGKGSYNFVAFNMATVCIICDLFAKMMCEPRFFPEIGDSNFKGEDCPSLKESFWLYDDFGNGELVPQFSPCFEMLPTDSRRALAAAYMIRFALSFLALHEYGHIIRGHIDLAFEENGRLGMSESDSNSFADLPYNELQAFELEADWVACHLVASAFFPRIRIPEKGDPFSAGEIFKMSYVAVGVFFVLFSRNSRGVEDHGDTHPHALTRYSLTTQELLKLAHENYHLSIPTMKQSMQSAIDELNQVSLSVEYATGVFTSYKDDFHVVERKKNQLLKLLEQISSKRKIGRKKLQKRIGFPV